MSNLAKTYTIATTCIVNSWNLVIFTRKSFRDTLFGFFLRCLAIADIIKSIGYLLELVQFIARRVDKDNEVICKLYTYIWKTLIYFAPWMLAMTAVDRTISIRHIKISRLIQRRRWIRYAIVFITIGCMLFPEIHNAIYIQYTQNSINGWCAFPEDLDYQMSLISTTCSAIFKIGLPFVVMTLANIVSAVEMLKLKRKIRTVKYNRTIKYIVTTLGLNLLFIVCEAPRIIFSLIELIYDEQLHVNNRATDFAVALYTVESFYSNFFYVFPIVQLIFYIGFNSVYRRETWRLIKLIFCCKHCVKK